MVNDLNHEIIGCGGISWIFYRQTIKKQKIVYTNYEWEGDQQTQLIPEDATNITGWNRLPNF